MISEGERMVSIWQKSLRVEADEGARDQRRSDVALRPSPMVG
jgi:hypothetical protein